MIANWMLLEHLRAGDPRLLAMAFSEPLGFLERRIRMMTSPRARRPLAGAAGFGRTRFRPARKDGRPVAAELVMPVEFTPPAAGES
jgi:hypothetical protein